MKKNKPAGVVATAELDETAQEAAQVDAQAEVEEDAAGSRRLSPTASGRRLFRRPPVRRSLRPLRPPRSAVEVPAAGAATPDRERSAPPGALP